MPVSGRTRYQALIDHLATAAGAEVVLTLAEIEALIGAPLSVSASVTFGYWTNSRHLHVRAWVRLGWRARLDVRNRCVIFARSGE